MKSHILCLLVFISIGSSLLYSSYIFLLRESKYWWSNISDVEKLISFRTENGLYFSYFQEYIESDTVLDGWSVLYDNNLTESPDRINILNRMNVWQEVLLGSVFRFLRFAKVTLCPIEFYVNSVLLLQGSIVVCVFLLSMLITKSLLAAVFTLALLALNRHHLSRVVNFVPLRENFSLPFWWMHVLLLHLLIRPKKPSSFFTKWTKIGFCLSTFLFCLQWQFGQFIILLEAAVVFIVDALELIPPNMTKFYYRTCLLSLLSTAVLQMGNTILLSSFALTFIVGSLIMSSLKYPDMMRSSFSGRLTWISIQATSRLVMATLMRLLLQAVFQQTDDSHIFSFLAAKMGLGLNIRDFHVNLYLCTDSFRQMSIDTYLSSLHLVAYPFLFVYMVLGIAVLLAALSVLWHDTEEEEELQPTIHESVVGGEGDFCGGCSHILSDRPELLYHFGMCTTMLFLALLVQRMQYLVTPYILLFATMLFGDGPFFHKLAQAVSSVSDFFRRNPRDQMASSDSSLSANIDTMADPSGASVTVGAVPEGPKPELERHADRGQLLAQRSMETVRRTVLVLMMAVAVVQTAKSVKSELKDLREFYDPDTVELMEWIRGSTLANESFAGSMQLMAAVKLVGKRPIANHPHYEDANLRVKTKKIYQMYGRQTPEYVHSVLKYYQVNYFIIEDSICMAKSTGCQLKDIIDIDNGHMPEKPHHRDFDLHFSGLSRFCVWIRPLALNSSYSRIFRFQFGNPTFRLYRVI